MYNDSKLRIYWSFLVKISLHTYLDVLSIQYSLQHAYALHLVLTNRQKVKFFFILRAAGYYLWDANNNLRCLLAADSRIPIYKLFTRRILFRFLSKCPVLPQVFLIGRKIAKYLDFNFRQSILLRAVEHINQDKPCVS